jgi:hypothetical protein
MRVVCAWCKNILVFGNSDGPPSHGICLACAVKLFEEADMDPNPFIMAYLRMRQPSKIYKEEESIRNDTYVE